MKNIIYFCPSTTTPIGGVKIIHRHSELINKLGGSSEILYAYGNNDPIEWFQHEARIKSDSQLNPKIDFAILRESLMFSPWRQPTVAILKKITQYSP